MGMEVLNGAPFVECVELGFVKQILEIGLEG